MKYLYQTKDGRWGALCPPTPPQKDPTPPLKNLFSVLGQGRRRTELEGLGDVDRGVHLVEGPLDALALVLVNHGLQILSDGRASQRARQPSSERPCGRFSSCWPA